jgi:hypothetical protein
MFYVLAAVAIIALIGAAVATIRRGRDQKAINRRLDSYCNSNSLSARLDAACRAR